MSQVPVVAHVEVSMEAGEFREGLPPRFKGKDRMRPASEVPPGVPKRNVPVMLMHQPICYPTQQICQIATRTLPPIRKDKASKKDGHLNRVKRKPRRWES